MPYYDYACTNPDCLHTTTAHFARYIDATQTIECAWCKQMMQRQISTPNFSVKGFSARNGYSGESK